MGDILQRLGEPLGTCHWHDESAAPSAADRWQLFSQFVQG